MSVELLNCDCLEYMRGCADNSFDLAIVDPPYGLGKKLTSGGNGSGWGKMVNSGADKWDIAPSPEYFTELFRVSKNQIIWGGNYFDLAPSRCFLIWDKVQRMQLSDCEMAWTSYDSPAKIFTYARGKLQGFLNPNRFHPCEKPIQLYQWLLDNYAEKDHRILDTHGGTFNSAIAAHYFGCDFVGMEIDKDYYDAACERFDRETRQLSFF